MTKDVKGDTEIQGQYTPKGGMGFPRALHFKGYNSGCMCLRS